MVFDLFFLLRDSENDLYGNEEVTVVTTIESLSMTFTADGKRQRLTLIFYSFLVILI